MSVPARRALFCVVVLLGTVGVAIHAQAAPAPDGAPRSSSRASPTRGRGDRGSTLVVIVFITRAIAGAVAAWFRAIERGDLTISWLEPVAAVAASR